MSDKVLNILAIDTALMGCCVAVSGGRKGKVSSIVEAMARGQAAKLVPLVQDTLKKHGIEFKDLELIGTTVGPGSFTGVRVGMSTARSFGLALGVPVVGVTTLDVFAHQVLKAEELADDETLVVLLETKRTDYYLGRYNAAGDEIEPPQALDLDTLMSVLKDQKVVFAGDAVKRLQQENDGKDSKIEVWRFLQGYDLPDPAVLVESVMRAYQNYKKSGETLPKPVPLYLRPADVSKPKRAPRKIIYS